MDFKIILNEQTPKAEVVKSFDIDEFNSFLTFAESHDTAVGLAANQCSLNEVRYNKRMFAVRDIMTNEWSLVINPKIIFKSEMSEITEEGCLTWPSKKIFAKRHNEIKVEYFDIEGNEKIKSLYGFEGQIWQHEINHLYGIEEKVVELYEKIDIIIKKVSNNEPCPCGSGKKYKHCCKNNPKI